jgi:hypothetical protein
MGLVAADKNGQVEKPVIQEPRRRTIEVAEVNPVKSEGLQLEEDGHIYTLNGRAIDGLTSTIAEAGIISNWGSEWYLTKGTAVHLATELWDKGTLDESTVDPQIVGYLESWKQFRKDQHYTPSHIEYTIYHPELLVATKIDRLPLLDIKSGGPEPWHILQVAFQRECLRIHKMDEKFRMNPMDVYLDPDGRSPTIKVYKTSEMMEAFKVYASMLYFIRWRRQKGVKNAYI